MSDKWTTTTLRELRWPDDGTWPDYILVGNSTGTNSEWVKYVPEKRSKIGQVEVNAVITDERYKECIGLLREANEKMNEMQKLLEENGVKWQQSKK